MNTTPRMTITPSLRPSTLRWLLLALGLWLSLAGTTALAQNKPGYTVPAAQLQQAVAQRFPMNYQVAGLVDLALTSPRLRLLPEHNRLAAAVDVDASGPALRRNYPGHFDLDFALRYEPSDQTIRAHQFQVRSLRMEGLNPGTTELLQAYLPGLVRDALVEVVLHKLRPQDLALPDTMGLQPDTLTVTRDGLLVSFAPKR